MTSEHTPHGLCAVQKSLATYMLLLLLTYTYLCLCLSIRTQLENIGNSFQNSFEKQLQLGVSKSDVNFPSAPSEREQNKFSKDLA